MKKRMITVIALSGMVFSLTGCYTHMCPTYSVKPVKEPATQTAKHLENSLEKAS